MWPELKTIFLAMAPINELRGTIPVAIIAYNLDPLKAFFLACLGNILPILFLLFFWKHIFRFGAQQSGLIKNFLDWILQRTRKRFYKNYSLYGDLALILLVAIPLPFTGAWTGSLAAFLFGIPYARALGLITIGVLISGAVVTFLTLGISLSFF
ncbi:small multi-drug export protein [Patescibacteria group bacterium]|nr:small multi-drug export protein [Patescibacteria group bacterium]